MQSSMVVGNQVDPLRFIMGTLPVAVGHLPFPGMGGRCPAGRPADSREEVSRPCTHLVESIIGTVSVGNG